MPDSLKLSPAVTDVGALKTGDQGLLVPPHSGPSALAPIIASHVGKALDLSGLTVGEAQRLATLVESIDQGGNTAAIGQKILALAQSVLPLLPEGARRQVEGMEKRQDERGDSPPDRHHCGLLEGLARALLPIFAQRWQRFPGLAGFGEPPLIPDAATGERRAANPIKLLLTGAQMVEFTAVHEERLGEEVRTGLKRFLEKEDELREALTARRANIHGFERDIARLKKLPDLPFTYWPQVREKIVTLCALWQAQARSETTAPLTEGGEAAEGEKSALNLMIAKVRRLQAQTNFIPKPLPQTFGDEISEAYDLGDKDVDTLEGLTKEMNNLSLHHKGYVRLELLTPSQAEELNRLLSDEALETTFGIAELADKVVTLYKKQHPRGFFVNGETKVCSLLADMLLNARVTPQKACEIENRLAGLEDVHLKAAIASVESFAPLLDGFRDRFKESEISPIKRLVCDLYLLNIVMPKYAEQIKGHTLEVSQAALEIFEELDGRRERQRHARGRGTGGSTVAFIKYQIETGGSNLLQTAFCLAAVQKYCASKTEVLEKALES